MNKKLLTPILLIITVLCACHKEKPAPFTCTVRNAVYGLDPAEYKQWIIFHSASGEILHVKKLDMDNKNLLMDYATTDISADQICDVTVALLRLKTPWVLLRTAKHVPSGKNLETYTYYNEPFFKTVSGTIAVSGMPDLDLFECIGVVPGGINPVNYPPDYKVQVPKMKTGETGVMLRWKAKNENLYRSHWVDIPGYPATGKVDISLSANDFSPEMIQHQIQLPFSGKWAATVRGIADPEKPSKHAILHHHNIGTDQPVADQIGFEQPPHLNIQYYWVNATVLSATSTFMEQLIPVGSPLIMPAIDFKGTEGVLATNGSFSTGYEGSFDIMEVEAFGNAGKVHWQVYGDPDQLAYCRLPLFPDSLTQVWPTLSGFNTASANYSDFNGIDGFDEFLDTDRSNPIWRARLGYRMITNYW